MTCSSGHDITGSRTAMFTRRCGHWTIALSVLAFALLAHVRADVYDLPWHTIGGGGGTSSGGGFVLSGTIGQHDAGVMSGGVPGNEFTLIGGFWAGAPDLTPPCPGDLNGDSSVGVADLLALLSCWGPTSPSCTAADLTNSGSVGVSDLLALLAEWGRCPD